MPKNRLRPAAGIGPIEPVRQVRPIATESMPSRSPRLRARPALRDLAQLINSSADGVVQFGDDGVLTYANASARAVLQRAGLAADDLHWRTVLGARTDARHMRRVGASLRRHDHWEGELWLPQGPIDRPFHARVFAHRGRQGQVRGHSALLRPTGAERDARQHIQRQADILRAITEALPATVVVVDAEGRYRFANRAFEQHAGLPAEQIIGRRAVDVLGADEMARRRPFMSQAYAGQPVDFTLDYPGPGGTRWMALSCIPLKVDGVVDGFVGIGQDVTAQHVEHRRLAQLAESDRLTGLLNRAGFEHAIEALMHDERSGSVALLYIDLDGFKPVNDRYGHPVGDAVLQRFAERLREATRASDIVARLGGDEFAVLLEGMHHESDALLVADKVLAAACQPYDVGGNALAISASIGVAYGLQRSAGWRELVARADASLYRAKAQGRARAAA